MFMVSVRCLLIFFVILPVFVTANSAPNPTWTSTRHDPSRKEAVPTGLVINVQSTTKQNKDKRKSGMDRDEVVAKFVEVLMNSEKYLRKIDSVDKKISHLESIFYKSFSRMFTELVDLAAVMKQLPSGGKRNNALRILGNDIRLLKQAALKQIKVNQQEKGEC
ncbi:hypothetical protein O0L34_g2567 [Tuta absoluta]|nr:hypothetical protein O0L34_g2567 [Tuta absoluta]